MLVLHLQILPDEAHNVQGSQYQQYQHQPHHDMIMDQRNARCEIVSYQNIMPLSIAVSDE